jgi:hypothetical protein
MDIPNSPGGRVNDRYPGPFEQVLVSLGMEPFFARRKSAPASRNAHANAGLPDNPAGEPSG